MTLTLPSSLLGLTLLVLPAFAGDDREALKFFENEIRPLLAAECYDCHVP